MRLGAYWQLARPFTLIAPALGIASGAVTAWGAEGGFHVTPLGWLGVLYATIGAAVLNAGSNALNQVADLEIDRVNKPERPLPSGRLTVRATLGFSVLAYALGILGGFASSPEAGWLFVAGAALSVIYSVGLRTKRHWLAANLTIALARGLFLKVAGWAAVRPPDTAEPWAIGMIFAAFTFGAINTKDFADVEGDRRGGVRTLVIARGFRVAAWFSAPFFVLPFLALPVLVGAGLLTGTGWRLVVLGFGLAAWGAYTVSLALRDPEGLAAENHPSWRHMYLIMFALQVGFALAYV